LEFTVPPGNIGTTIQGPGTFVDLFSSGLNGTVLAGQSLSLDLVLSNDVLARLFLADPGGFGLGLTFVTNAATFPGFAGPTTGFLLDSSGNQFGDTQVAGRADGCCPGFVSIGLVSFTSSNLEGAEAVDISGVHFDTSLPNTGFVITDSQLRFGLNSPDDGVTFGTAQQLPEPSTLGLTLAGALMIGLAGMLRRSIFRVVVPQARRTNQRLVHLYTLSYALERVIEGEKKRTT
jgi:hypothetical protein